MTDKKLLKYLKKSFEPPNGEQILTPVVLTDSKGKYLQAQCSLPIENSIRWWDKSGRNSKQGLKWLRDNLETEIALIGNISLYIWVGTCDLTEYNHPYIKLRQEPEEIVQSVINNFQKIAEILKNYPACKLTFLKYHPTQYMNGILVVHIRTLNNLLIRTSLLLNISFRLMITSDI
ncbi:unnamed protein product [Mytilus edulis]|uniref:Uncharacterized protein n=1 Tax=Mytilus edulis TaxID=6550 RepID=A0A8S3TH82_MYTED|nr:unnamed protein product [Mytilus edulis]